MVYKPDETGISIVDLPEFFIAENLNNFIT